ncbi:MAG: ABC transporter permease [Burkholderiales bacterium 70-64]|nr:MAG: ABC transporter permease [Burkholderiales bacterium 70-64]
MSESTTRAAAPPYRPGTSDAEIEAAAARAERRHRLAVRSWQVLLLAALLGGWELLARAKIIDTFFFSSPSAIAARLYEWITQGANGAPLWYHVWVTLEEALLGFFSGFVLGILAGVALGRNRMASEVLTIYIKVFNSVPRVVLAPIFILIFGLGLTSKVALSFVMVFFIVFANAFQGVREADRSLIANARILGASKWQLTRSVIVPSAMSWIFASLHVSFGFAIVGAIVGEFVGARHGVGVLIQVAGGAFDTAGMYAAIVIIMVVALAAEYAVTFLEKRLAKWRPEALQEAPP